MSRIAAFVLLAASACFVLWLGHGLPADVASHFDGAGRPDGSMSRTGFVATMIVMAVAPPPAMLLLLPRLRDTSRPNVPAAGRWSAPASGSQPAIGAGAAAAFAAGLSVFMDFAAWRVAAANAGPSAAALSMPAMWVGAAVFLAFVAAWSVWLVSRRRSR